MYAKVLHEYLNEIWISISNKLDFESSVRVNNCYYVSVKEMLRTFSYFR